MNGPIHNPPSGRYVNPFGGQRIRWRAQHENSPARRLYERLGFVMADENPRYLAMAWRLGDQQAR